VICSGDVAVYRDDVKTTIERGHAQRPDAVWVCVEPKSDRMTHDVMLSLDIEPVVLPMADALRRKPRTWRDVWKGNDPDAWPYDGYDVRRLWRDYEMLLCDELIVFHKRTGNSPWRERYARKLELGIHRNLFVVELGAPPKAKSRKRRKPVGV
jgi:hypothetical protein